MKATIHVFSYGEAQIISDTLNFKTGVDKFTKLQAVINDVKSKKPSDKTVADYHVINIFGDLKSDYISKRAVGTKPSDEDKSSFSLEYKTLDTKKIDALVVEFQTLAKG